MKIVSGKAIADPEKAVLPTILWCSDTQGGRRASLNISGVVGLLYRHPLVEGNIMTTMGEYDPELVERKARELAVQRDFEPNDWDLFETEARAALGGSVGHDLIVARLIVAKCAHWMMGEQGARAAEAIIAGKWDKSSCGGVQLAYESLRIRSEQGA